jgi:myo-inositol-1(or 4)-monophosphatase
MKNNLETRLNFMKKLAINVGNFTLQGLGKCQYVEKASKYGYDVLTEFDSGAESMINQAITEQYGEAIISEECGLFGDKEQAREKVWIVDPIDGTLNFQHGIPLYGISIGYCENGVPVAGVIFLPALGELFFASKGNGAFIYNTKTQEERSIIVDKEDDFRKLIIAMEGQEALQKIVHSYFNAGFSHRSLQVFRCATFSLAYLACGRIHLYVNSLLNLWDCAAGEVIIQEAGGLSCKNMQLTPIFPYGINTYLDLDAEKRKVFRLNLIVASVEQNLKVFYREVSR